jgi:uncharacterized membrane protein HdeD (DUF308 family)
MKTGAHGFTVGDRTHRQRRETGEGNMAGTHVTGRLRTRIDWPVLAVAGVVWLVFGMVVLQLNLASAWSLRLAAGLLLIIAAFGHLINVQVAQRWQWTYGVLAAAFFVIGMVALVWPDPSYLALTRVIAWFLLVKGAADVFLALAGRPGGRLWGLAAVVGLLEIAVGFGVAGVPAGSIPLLPLWVGLIALSKGVTDLLQALELRSWRVNGLTSPGAGGVVRDDPADRYSSWRNPSPDVSHGSASGGASGDQTREM